MVLSIRNTKLMFNIYMIDIFQDLHTTDLTSETVTLTPRDPTRYATQEYTM